MITKEEQKENRKKWVEALRSGKYKQGYGYLRTKDDKYCCLGVLTELAGVAVTGTVRKGGDTEVYSFDQRFSVCPLEARDWVGLRTSLGSFKGEINSSSLVALNDGRKSTFDQIADVIESEPEGLFL